MLTGIGLHTTLIELEIKVRRVVLQGGCVRDATEPKCMQLSRVSVREMQQRKHEAEQDNWFCKPESTAYIQKWCAYIEMRARWLPTEQQVSGPSSTAAESSFSLDPKLESTSLAVNSSGTGPRKKQLEERKPG